MKRFTSVILLIIAICSFFSGCGATQQRIETTPEPTAKSKPEPVPVAEHKTLGFTLDELSTIIGDAQKIGEFITYESEKYSISKEGSTSDGTVCFSVPGEDDISAIYFLSYAKASSSAYHRREARASQEAIISFCDEAGIRIVADQFEIDNTIVFSVCAKDCPFVGEVLPITLREFRSPDEFFNDRDRQNAYLNYLNQCNYSALFDYLTTYLTETDVPPNDVVQSLANYCSQIIPLTDQCVIEYDPFDDITTVLYLGVTDISSDICVVPIMTTNSPYSGSSVDYKIGFINTEWVFFDKVIAIAGDKREELSIKSYNVTHDVIGGGQIAEYFFTDATTFVGAIKEAGEAQSGSIRFENTNNRKTYDQALTEQELSAINTIEHISLLHSTLYRALDTWESK